MNDTGTWPSWRYVWRMHRFRPRRQLINLTGVFVGWGSNVLPGIAAKIVFDHIADTERNSSLDWLWWPIALIGAWVVAGIAVSFTLQSTNGAFAYANAGMLQRNMLRRILELPGGRALPASPGETVSRFRDDTEAVVWYPIGLNNVIGSLFTATIAIVVMVRIDARMTTLVVAPLAVVIALVQAREAGS